LQSGWEGVQQDVEVAAGAGTEPEVYDLVEAGVHQGTAWFGLVEACQCPGGFVDRAAGVLVDSPFDDGGGEADLFELGGDDAGLAAAAVGRLPPA